MLQFVAKRASERDREQETERDREQERDNRHKSDVSQCVAVCCSVLQCVVVCCSVSRCVAVCYSDVLVHIHVYIHAICIEYINI